MSKINLYKKDQKGSIRIWSVEKVDNGLLFEYGLLNGEIQFNDEPISVGLAGRTVEEQIESRMNSRIQSKLDSGYCKSLEEAEKGIKLNAMGHKKPMLAERFDKMKKINYESIHIQNKLNGHRCLIVNDCGEMVAYSRNGKQILTIDHIMQQMTIPEGMVIDGELYCHGMPLQKISSIVRNVKNADKINHNLKFICYDVISKENYLQRYEIIKSLSLGAYAEIIDSFVFSSADNPNEYILNKLDEVVKNGYEGLMLRQDCFPYEDGKRSKSLIKVKKFIDEEFEVFDITNSVDGWAILHLKSKITNKPFKATAPGNVFDKRNVAANKASFIGKKVNIKYLELTVDGVPSHPVATMWREIESE